MFPSCPRCDQGIEKFCAVWEHKIRCKNFLRDLTFDPRPPEVFFVTRLPKGLLHPPLIFYTEHMIPLYLLPVYRYGPPQSIDTKMSTIELHMTLLVKYLKAQATIPYFNFHFFTHLLIFAV